MRWQGSSVLIVTLVAIATFSGCATSSAKSPDVSASIKTSLADSGLKNISVVQDRHKGVVTLTGQVLSEMERSEAESIARSLAAGEIVGNEIEVASAGDGSTNAEFDKDIGAEVRAVLMQHQLRKYVRYEVKDGAVTLTGDVASSTRRADAESLVTSIPNVRQVVNKLQVTNQKVLSEK